MNLEKMLLHPLFIHFPIALCFFEIFLLSLAGLKRDKAYLRFARLTFQVLAVCLTVTLATGWRDAGGAVEDLFQGGVRPHFYSACVFSIIVLIRLVLLKRYRLEDPRSLRVQAIGSVLMAAAVAVTAYWGGKLVYSDA